MPAYAAVSSDKSRLVDIFGVVWDVALNRSGIAWAGNQKYEFPDGETLGDNLPFLVVTCPEIAGYAQDGALRGKEMIRSPENREPTWDYYVYGLYPYKKGNPLSWETPLNDMVTLEWAFSLYWGLDGTCEKQNVSDPKVKKILTRDNVTRMEALLVVRAYETLEMDY